MGLTIRTGSAAIGSGIEIGAPPPDNGAQRLCPGINGFDGGSVRVGSVTQLIIGDRIRMHVAMGAVPEHRLVIQIVEMNSAICCIHMIDPCRDEIGTDGATGIRRIIPAESCPIRMTTIATVGSPGINRLLWAILGNAEAAGIIPCFGGPTDQGDREQARRFGPLILLDETISRGTVGQRGRIGIIFRDIFEIPVTGMTGGVGLPVIACGPIPPPAADR